MESEEEFPHHHHHRDVDDPSSVVPFLRDYLIPIIVFVLMWRFLCTSVFIPIYRSGVVGKLRRGSSGPTTTTTNEEENCSGEIQESQRTLAQQ